LLIHHESGGKIMAKAEILLLGDGSHPFRTMGWVLEYRGFSIKALQGPEAALEALVKNNYDLIIAKLSRKDKDNFAVLQQAKKISPLTKIMLVTDRLDLAFPLEAYAVEVDDYIIMPISAGEFWRRVETCLEGLVIDLAPENSVSEVKELPYYHSEWTPMVLETRSEIRPVALAPVLQG
jgi:PleD family two-component response regulator